MSNVNEHEDLLWVSRPWNYTDPDIAGGSRVARPLDLGSKTQTPTGVQACRPPLPVAAKKRAKPEKGSNEKKEKESGGDGDGGEDGGGGGAAGGGFDHELHIWTERERRKKMRDMFSTLHALLPQLPSKADKSSIVDEAVSYITHCQQTLQKLQKLKFERFHGIAHTTNNDQTLVSPTPLSEDTREAFMADQIASKKAKTGPSNTSRAIMTPRFNVPLSFQTFTSQNVILSISGEQAFISICAPRRKGFFVTICLILEKHKLDLMSSHVTSDLNKMTIMMQVQTKITPDQFPDGFPVDEVYKQAALEMTNVVASFCYQI